MCKQARPPHIKMLTFIAVPEYRIERQSIQSIHRNYTIIYGFTKAVNTYCITIYKKSTLQKFKILNIKKYSCRNRCRTGARNCSGYRSVKQHGDITIQRKQKSSLYLQLVFGNYDRQTKQNHTPKIEMII